ncbi:MAG: diguanylate cyclase, partial [Pseudomonadales bacterium]|nr:diguanylate cyclase [Pseudomonadales bacterium]
MMLEKSLDLMSLRRFVTHYVFIIWALLAASVWLVEPLIDALVFQRGTVLWNILQPDSAEVLRRAFFSSVFLVAGITITLVKLQLDKKQQHLETERQLLKTIFESEPECVKTLCPEGTLQRMNPAGLGMIEADAFALVKGVSIFKLIAPEYEEAFRNFHQRVMQGHSEQLVFDIVGQKGTRKTVESHAVPLYNTAGDIEGHLAVTRDITNAKQLSDKLNYQASHDGLTGLVNRVEFEHRLHNSIARASADNCTHAVFFMDLDQFKVINDTCGHLAGDQLLIRTGAVLRKQLRQ